jgi:type IV pilus assembly protein PilA
MAIDAGTIVITYGNQANAANLTGETLSLKPLVSANEDVIWVCGNADIPNSAVEAPSGNSGAVDTSVLDKYVPSNCRPGANAP